MEGNYCVTKAFQYTSITSVTLLDCLTVPAVMALAYWAFRARYRPGHLAGAALCLGGVAVLVLADSRSRAGGRDPLRGDLLVVLGALLYAVSNVAQERLLADCAPSELLGMLGAFGSLIAGVQALALESGARHRGAWDATAAACFVAFACALFAFYNLVPRVLMWSSSAVLNLSLLTSDFMAAGARVALFGGFGGTSLSFALSFALVAGGLVLYALSGATHEHRPKAPASYEQLYDDYAASSALDGCDGGEWLPPADLAPFAEPEQQPSVGDRGDHDSAEPGGGSATKGIGGGHAPPPLGRGAGAQLPSSGLSTSAAWSNPAHDSAPAR